MPELHDMADTLAVGAHGALGEVQREMTLLLADMKKHPLRYHPF